VKTPHLITHYQFTFSYTVLWLSILHTSSL
jgi:hypothetical protein